ncbi:MAG TPA: 2'-deoxycytidine 5'-triphosphate deaminase [Hyphomicrobiaceae bacterium]|nr:2'-deoxycytidine 5'-triphosphate deaminase [Hyphomicrobiaceae bacterium]
MDDDTLPRSEVGGKAGLLPAQHIEALLKRRKIRAAEDVAADQVQPASLDLRLGAKAYRVRASFLPGRERSVLEQLATLKQHEIALDGGAVLEQGCVYLVELQEQLELPATIAAIANPKSSTGRIDVFTRLITDHSEAFDWVEAGYRGPLYAEIFPRTFSIKVRKGSRLNQIRFLRRTGSQDRYWRPSLSDGELRALDASTPLIDGEAGKATIRFGLNIRVDLKGESKGAVIGYRALRYTEVLDVDGKGAHERRDFWEPMRSHGGRLILNPNQFYILASKERIYVPPAFAAEMIPIDPMMGEFRAHYAGFFDPGFGATDDGGLGSRAVLEVRTLDVPFVLEEGQIIARLVYEHLAEAPIRVYGRGIKSHYQGQGLKLSKHFK